MVQSNEGSAASYFLNHIKATEKISPVLKPYLPAGSQYHIVTLNGPGQSLICPQSDLF